MTNKKLNGIKKVLNGLNKKDWEALKNYIESNNKVSQSLNLNNLSLSGYNHFLKNIQQNKYFNNLEIRNNRILLNNKDLFLVHNYKIISGLDERGCYSSLLKLEIYIDGNVFIQKD